MSEPAPDPGRPPPDPRVDQPVPPGGPSAAAATGPGDRRVEDAGRAATPVTLPAAVRARVLSVTAELLPAMTVDAVPVSLHRIARFTPGRRVRLGGSAIAAALDARPEFRAAVVAGLRRRGGPDPAGLAAVIGDVEAGRTPAGADSVDVAAVAYLTRADGWAGLVERAGSAARDAARTRAQERVAADRSRAADRLSAELARTRARAESAETALAAANETTEELRREIRVLTGAVRRAERHGEQLAAGAAAQREHAEAARSTDAAELRRLRARLGQAEQAAAAARAGTRAARDVDDVRLAVLLETLAGTARGITEELALRPTARRPADNVIADADGGETGGSLRVDDAARLGRLLSAPAAHLVVDGYNVTKTGYPDLSLADQRGRLLAGLGSLAARTGTEITCVFDGDRKRVLATPAARGVRVAFSVDGELADQVIVALADAEPPGRALVVVTSDRAVADAVVRRGYSVGSSAALLALLERPAGR